jgi:hypothetical protein
MPFTNWQQVAYALFGIFLSEFFHALARKPFWSPVCSCAHGAEEDEFRTVQALGIVLLGIGHIVRTLGYYRP